MQENNLPQDLLTLHTVDAADSIIMYLVGECDMANVPMLMEELTKVIHSGKNVILDVHLLTYMDSMGMSAIGSACKGLAERESRLQVVGAHGIFLKIIRLTRLDLLISFFDTVEDARNDSNRLMNNAG